MPKPMTLHFEADNISRGCTGPFRSKTHSHACVRPRSWEKCKCGTSVIGEALCDLMARVQLSFVNQKCEIFYIYTTEQEVNLFRSEQIWTLATISGVKHWISDHLETRTNVLMLLFNMSCILSYTFSKHLSCASSVNVFFFGYIYSLKKGPVVDHFCRRIIFNGIETCFCSPSTCGTIRPAKVRRIFGAFSGKSNSKRRSKAIRNAWIS